MAVVGYARVSSVGQSLDVQHDLLKAAGCEKIFSEKRSGSSTEGRDQLAEALDWVREGDVLVVCRLDRLARSIVDLRKIIDRLTVKGVGFRCLQQGAIDTTRSDGRLLLNILASFAEFETDIRRERQADGIAKAKAEGKYRGRPATIDPAEVKRLHGEGVGPTAIAKLLGVGRASVYRILGIGHITPPDAPKPLPKRLKADLTAPVRGGGK
jgi:DNA invertase Pin-like site-specific DNA recombinase